MQEPLVKSPPPPSSRLPFPIPPPLVPSPNPHLALLRPPLPAVRCPPPDSHALLFTHLPSRDSFLGCPDPLCSSENLSCERVAAQMDRGSGVGGGGGMPPPQQMPDAVGFDAEADPQFVLLRNSIREKIFDYTGRKQMSADWRRRLPELARRLEEILFRKFPNKSEYYSMTLGPIEPQLQYAIKSLSAQNAQRQRDLEMSRQIASSPGITQGASQNSGVSYVTHNMGPSSSGAGMVPQNAYMGASLPGEAPAEHVNTLLSLGMNSTHHRSRMASNFPAMMTQAPPAPVKEVPKEPKFSCPVCMNELVNASSTTCGHIFCQKCIRASIQAQSKCPTCRTTLSLSDFHRVYLPTMD